MTAAIAIHHRENRSPEERGYNEEDDNMSITLNGKQKRIGLALSGGGFRRPLFIWAYSVSLESGGCWIR